MPKAKKQPNVNVVISKEWKIEGPNFTVSSTSDPMSVRISMRDSQIGGDAYWHHAVISKKEFAAIVTHFDEEFTIE